MILNVWKKILIVFVLSSVAIAFLNNIYATDEIIRGADTFIDIGTTEVLKPHPIKQTSDTIFNMFIAIGTAVVMVVGAVLGVQFIMGSAEEKAKVQESLIPFIVGAIVIFGAFGIWSLAVKIFNGL